MTKWSNDGQNFSTLVIDTITVFMGVAFHVVFGPVV